MSLFQKKKFTLEMGLSRKEFISLLDSQSKLVYELEGNDITFTFAGQKALLFLGPEGTRKLTFADLPTILLSFDFSEMGDQQQASFMKVFLLKFQRGGG